MQGKMSKVCRVPDGDDVAGGGIDVNGGDEEEGDNIESLDDIDVVGGAANDMVIISTYTYHPFKENVNMQSFAAYLKLPHWELVNQIRPLGVVSHPNR